MVPIQNEPLVQVLLSDLHLGEAEAITLAKDLGLEFILMDEPAGRIKARSLGLKPVGILGLLLSAKKAGKIESLGAEMQALRREVGFFISEELRARLLIVAGEGE
jgi:predicted nucleic acid-binding protein